MATGGKQRDTRDSRERARIYQARKAFHESLSRRRTRDNLIAAIGGGVLILALIGGQAAYFVAGPGAPVPSPTTTDTPAPTTTPDPSASPVPTPDPSASPVPTPDPSSSPTETPAP